MGSGGTLAASHKKQSEATNQKHKHRPKQRPSFSRRPPLMLPKTWRMLRFLVFAFVIALALSSFLLSGIAPFLGNPKAIWAFLTTRRVRRIAFGSGTTPENTSQPVWTRGVIPSSPDVWIWLGDMAYLDEPEVNCTRWPLHPQCNCTSDWFQQQGMSCVRGNSKYAITRMQQQLQNPDYVKFLQFMCPRYKPSNTTPIPDGSDPSSCPRHILGVYDDRDFGWAHGYKRLMHKDPLKSVFLDALGAPKEDPRRDRGDGIQAVYHLNEALPGQQIDVFLLDERYYRENLPCHIRRDFCTSVMDLDRPHSWRSWCGDFLGREVARNRWSCCDKDEKLFQAWCGHEAHRNHSLWEEACNPAQEAFGSQKISVRKKGKDVALWDVYIEEQPEPHNSQYCEVLGRQQRLWLQEELQDSVAPIKIIVSPSPVFTNPLPQPCSPFPKELSTAATLTGPYGSEPPAEPELTGLAGAASGLAAAPSAANGSASEAPSASIPPVAPFVEDPVTNVTQCTCSGDDWECYKPAQLHFLEMLSRAERGCVVLLTGDMGYSDIKVFRPGPGRAYTDLYRSSQHYRPIYQVMASGLTRRPRIDTSCSPGNAWTHDPLKMRHPSECSVAPAPSFGMVEVDWDREKVVKLQVRDGDTSQVRIELVLDLAECLNH
ncbi:hypothetical protein CLOM_g16278 [Closterium sp. NIES-68]|nr:hypothetical protein CLOM_g16278 [Closterium sp. NIES-68]GJP71560.1 hypothetical protein CLOP_g2383 [Closterium sp. NIES-67]GJP79332.1 hypothetical protein CLOP_g9577 [Closterium sp. NIES-67]